MKLSLKQIAEFINGKCVNCEDIDILSVTTDTRKIENGCLFVALKGDRFDGHDFLVEAIKKGAAAVVSEKRAAEISEKIPVIEVKNTYDALLDIAKGYRETLKTKVIGVTGSVGKTTTKDMIAAVLSQEMLTSKTDGNFNNHIGVPKTIFDINESTEASVIEMGMNHLGEISRLTRAAKPDIAVLTCIGVSHIENLGSRENILKAKLEILESMSEDAPVIINQDNDILSDIKELGKRKIIRVSAEGNDADVTARNISYAAEGSRFDIYLNNEFFVNVFLPAVGIHNVQNALLATAVGIEFNLSELQIAAGLSSYVPSGMRQKINRLGDITFIEDCYNASPQSMMASVSVLSTVSREGRKIAVLGDMLELGDIAENEHYEVGKFAGERCDEVICTGNLAKKIKQGAEDVNCHSVFFDDISETVDYLVKNLKKGDCVLFKASHSMKFEDIITAVYSALQEK